MKKIFFIFPLFFLFLAIGVSSASDIIIPFEEQHKASYTDEITFTIVVSSEDYTGRIEVDDKWAAPDVTGRNPAFYNKTASQVGIEINYEKEFYISERTSHDVNVKIKAKTPNMYCSLITFTPIDDSGSVILSRGTWITMDMQEIFLDSLGFSKTNKTEIELKGLSSEKQLEIYLNQNPVGTVEIIEGNNFTASITLSEGNNTIFMKAVESDLQSTNSIFVILDTTPPDAPMINPPPTIVNTSTITVSGKAEANSIVHIFVNQDNQKDASVSGSCDFTVSNILLEKGNNTITAIAVDEVGNPSVESEPVYVLYNETISSDETSSTTETTNKTKRIELSVDKHTITLPEEGNATCNITASVFDANGTLMNTTLKINFSITSGNATLSAVEVEAQEGKGETVVECGEEGNVTIKAEPSLPDIEGDSLMITFKKSEPVSTDTNETAPTSLLTKEINETEVSALNETNETNETNATTNVSESELKKEGKGIFGILGYVAIGIVIVIASLFLYVRIGMGKKNQKEKKQVEGDKSSWVVSGVQKKGDGEYEIAVNNDGKRTTIKLTEKLYKQLIKKKRLAFGNHTILIPARR